MAQVSPRSSTAAAAIALSMKEFNPDSTWKKI
jgi:hypothetical protein